MECYHPENNAWTDMPPMKYSRSGAGVAVLNQFIYVCGGFDGSRQLGSVERFDTGETPRRTSPLPGESKKGWTHVEKELE
jgi:hypothetical protein